MIKLTRKMNIKSKLGILFLIFCISIAILGYMSVSISEDNKNILKDVHSKSQNVLVLQNEVISPLYNLRQLSQSLVMAPNKDIRASIEKDLFNISAILNKKFKEMKKIDTKLYSLWEEYRINLLQTQKYLKEGFEEGAYINVTTEGKYHFETLLKQLFALQKYSLSNVSVAYNEAEKKTRELKVEIVLSIILVLIFAILIGWFITSNILKSIYTVQNGLENFFKYLNDKETRVEKIEIHSNDEFRQMAMGINKNISYISNNIEQNEVLIKNATKVLENIKSGNLGTRLTKDTKNKSLNELKNMINDMIDNLEDKIQNEIDQRLEQEQILIQQSKLAAMGEMIGNIAHQWRQPLAQISAIHMNMKITYDFGNFTKEYLNSKIKEANTLTSYMSQTINDFQDFFKPQGEKEYFSVEQACRDAYFIVESSLNYHGVVIDFDTKDDCKVLGYKNEYSQVILNIISNAKDIILERKVKNPHINIEIKSGQSYAIVKIQDNAGGVSADIIDKIFDPYFTTRHKTQGTGIGLYMAKNIIERNMNGLINVRNENDGALFTVKVPRVVDSKKI